jgi:hypothetical protein
MTRKRDKRKERLREVWRRVFGWATKKCRRVPLLDFRVGCPRIRAHRRTDPRAFMHVGHLRGTVCAAAEAADLTDEHLVGLFLHEIGHPLAYAAWKRTEQEDADLSVSKFLGVKIRYRGPLLLEWVPKTAVRKILRRKR